jgi:ABC-type multidrug transport system ATPase subunit
LTVLRLHEVSKAYIRGSGARAALRGISLEISNGVYVILGPNGSGKSTLLRIMAGITKPDKGVVECCNKKYWSTCGEGCLAALRRRDIGFLPQNLLVPRQLRVIEAAGMPLWLSSIRNWREETLRALRELGIEGLAGRRVKELSIGQRQRVALARAFIAGSKALLLDEPFSHLDEEGILLTINALAKRAGRAAIVVTTPYNSVAELLRKAVRESRLIVMESGEIKSVE